MKSYPANTAVAYQIRPPKVHQAVGNNDRLLLRWIIARCRNPTIFTFILSFVFSSSSEVSDITDNKVFANRMAFLPPSLFFNSLAISLSFPTVYRHRVVAFIVWLERTCRRNKAHFQIIFLSKRLKRPSGFCTRFFFLFQFTVSCNTAIWLFTLFYFLVSLVKWVPSLAVY